ncbi:MFS transporter [Streptomyces sp. NPDC012888]|uniref:MFS transporter n=1 Tax=Streptomyces sp. NPDC012888 TaxID=3364855 RepID=UPI003693FCCF
MSRPAARPPDGGPALPPPPGTATPVRPARSALLAASVGNFAEWYEFGVYGAFATVIADRFQAPGTDRAQALVATYATFAVAFFCRPLGALLFGRLADRAGRRPALVLAVCLMTGATAAIGMLPDHATAGAAAPWLLTLLRALQGLSAGGEFGSAVSLMTETAPPGRRGAHGAWQSFTVALGLLAGAGAAAGLAALLTEPALHAWGWRIPFLSALPLGAVALWLRLRLPESPPPGPGPRTSGPEAAAAGSAAGSGSRSAAGSGSRSAAGSGSRSACRSVVLAVGRIMGWSAAGYTFLVVLPSYLQLTLGASFQHALTATFLANLGFAAAVLPAGALSDRTGRRPVMLAGCVLVVLLSLPFLHLLRDPSVPPAAKAALLLAAGATIGLLAGPGPAMLAESFPRYVRSTGLGLAYALSNAVFSGCAGLIVTALVRHTGNPDVPALYAATACAFAVPALLTLRPDDHTRPLR